MSIVVLIAAIAVPQLLAGLERSRAQAAARFLAARLMLARDQAVAGSATMALRFVGESHAFAVYVDGNRNGVRAQEIQTGVDRILEPATDLAQLFPGVAVAAVAVGNSGILSFTPAGTSSSGTITIRGRDGSQFGVRVYGATGRTRVLRYNQTTLQFEEGM